MLRHTYIALTRRLLPAVTLAACAFMASGQVEEQRLRVSDRAAQVNAPTTQPGGFAVNAPYTPSRASAKTSLTLDEAIAYALANSPMLEGERLQRAIAETTNEIARARWKPQAGVNVDAQHNFRLPVSIVPDFENPESGETQAVTFGAVNTATTAFYVDQLLYSPEIIRDVRLSDPLVRSAELAIAEVARDLRLDVSTAFYETLRAQEQLTLARQDIERLERALRDAELRSEGGLDSKVPRLRARIALNDARAREEGFAERLESQRAQLAQLLGYETDAQELRLAYTYEEIERESTAVGRPELAPARRAEIRRLQTDRRAQELRTEYAENSWLPSVSLGAGYDFSWLNNEIDALFGRTFRSSYGALTVRMPFFRGGARFREVELARIRETQLDKRIASTTNLIEAEYAVADNDLTAALATLQAARANRDLAREVYETVRLQYREGITPFLDVVIAENDLQAARNQSLNATIDAAIARVRLRRAAGTL